MSSDKFIDIQKEQLRQIKCIINDQDSLTRDQLEVKYEEFAKKLPKTWINIMDRSFFVSQLERKIELYEQFYKRSSGDHSNRKFEADVGLGENLAKEFLYPATGVPSQESRNLALGLARKKLEG